MNDTDLDPVRRRILDAALRHVPFDGWSRRMLQRSAADAGQDAAMAERCFPRGIADLIGFFVAEADRHMAAELAARDLSDVKIRERIALAVRLRLAELTPHREAVRRALAWQSLPGHAGDGLRGLYRTVDAIWYAIGDRSTDASFYSRRALLAGVYASTLLHWLDDRSDDFAETWDFLDRRISDVMRIQTMRRPFDRLAGRLPSPFGLLGRLRHCGARRRARREGTLPAAEADALSPGTI